MGLEPIKQRKKGVALLWTLIICLVLLIVSGTIVGYIIKDSRSAIRIEDSAQAYAAAKSGMDWGIWYVNNSNEQAYTAGADCDNNGVVTGKRMTIDLSQPIDISVPTGPDVLTDVTIKGNFCVEEGYDNSNDVIVITSRGMANEVQRELNYKVHPRKESSVIDGSLISSNFRMDYDFWLDNTIAQFDFGVIDNAGGYAVAMEIKEGMACLKAGNQQVGNRSTDCITLEPPQDSIYRFSARIKYVKGVMAVLEIKERDPSTLVPSEDNKSVSIPLFGGSIAPKASLYFSPKQSTINNPDAGEYYLITDLADSPMGYVDNVNLYQ